MPDVDVTTIVFESSEGVALEADVLTPDAPLGVAVVCHPHPTYGGTRRDAVVGALCRGLVDASTTVLRFDFRGAGGSAGDHGGGEPERADVLAAIDAAADGALPLTLAGYSFGADIALSVDDPRITGWLTVAPPLLVASVDPDAAGTDPRPTRIVVGGSDDIAPGERIETRTSAWTNTEITTVAGADHFFVGAMAQLASIATDTAVAHRSR